jgi:DNA-binding NarL/FixJ family response regulator
MHRTIYFALADEQLHREIPDIVEGCSDLTLVGSAKDGVRAALEIRSLSPDIVLIDHALPLLSGLKLARSIRTDSVLTKIILVTDRPELTYRLVADLLALDGFVQQSRVTKELPSLLQSICR